MSTNKTNIVRDACRRYPNLPSRTLATHILNLYGDLFNNDLEYIRGRVRYFRGKSGDENRGKASDKTLFTPKQPLKLPDTWP